MGIAQPKKVMERIGNQQQTILIVLKKSSNFWWYSETASEQKLNSTQILTSASYDSSWKVASVTYGRNLSGYSKLNNVTGKNEIATVIHNDQLNKTARQTKQQAAKQCTAKI